MGKTRVSVKAKLSNLCLSVVVAAGQKCGVATATATASSPTPAVESTPVMVVESAMVATVVVGDVAVLKSNEPLPSIEKLQALDAALGFKSFKKSPSESTRGETQFIQRKEQ